MAWGMGLAAALIGMRAPVDRPMDAVPVWTGDPEWAPVATELAGAGFTELTMHTVRDALALGMGGDDEMGGDFRMPEPGFLARQFPGANSFVAPPVVITPDDASRSEVGASGFGFEPETDPFGAFGVKEPSLGWLTDAVREQERVGEDAEATAPQSLRSLMRGGLRDPYATGWPSEER